MSYAIKDNQGNLIELTPGSVVTLANGGVISYADMLKWSDAERTNKKIKVIEEDPVPDGQRIVSSFLALRNGRYIREHILEPIPPPPEPPVPEEISDRQFFEACAMRGLITEQEAEDAVAIGAIPKKIDDAIKQLPQQYRFAARMRLKGAVIFRRHNPTTLLLQQLLDINDAQTDDIWELGASLE